MSNYGTKSEREKAKLKDLKKRSKALNRTKGKKKPQPLTPELNKQLIAEQNRRVLDKIDTDCFIYVVGVCVF